jgi:small multidrug resistance pump
LRFLKYLRQLNFTSNMEKNSMLTAWLFLAMGIVFEVLGTLCMKFADGFSRLLPSIFVFVFYIIALICLIFVLKKMEVSIAYAIWASLGTALIAIIGIVFFKESVSALKITSIAFIIIGILGLELFD